MVMVANDHVVYFDVLKVLIESLPIGVVITKNDDKIVMRNSLFSNIFPEGEFETEFSKIINKNLVPSVNHPIHLHNHNGVLKKEIVSVFGDEYQYYFFFSNNQHFLNKENPEMLLFQEMLDIADVCLVMVDTEGYVQVLTRSFAEILGVDQESSIGKHVTEVIDNTRMHLVVKSGNFEFTELQRIKDDYIIAARFPVIKQGKVVGAVGKVLVNNTEQLTALTKRLKYLDNEINRNRGIINARNNAYYTFDHLIGESPAFVEMKNQARKAARSESNVLILGESGTGKELFAHSIHNGSSRAMGAFVKVNCGAIPAELIESELFGYEEGSFTGAKRGGKMGKFEVADGGTIFLDEIGELPLHLQVKILHVLQEKEIERIGGNGTIPVNVRIIAATNRNLEKMVEKGEFRLDLYYRLKVMQIVVPSLEERAEDITLLVNHFIEKYEKLMKKSIKGINESALYELQRYSWPGNIRELENTIESALNNVDEGEYITLEHLPEDIIGSKEQYTIRPLTEVMEETERSIILNCLRMMNGNKSETAKQLGISRTSLYEKMDKYRL